MKKKMARRLAEYLRELVSSAQAAPPFADRLRDGGKTHPTVIEEGKGKEDGEGNEGRKPCAVIGIPYSSDAAEKTVRKEEEETMNRKAKYMSAIGAAVAAAFALGACGGGGSGAVATSAPVVSTGTMVKGSVIVNGVRFEDTAANIHADDTGKVFLPADLKDGMTVKVRGEINADRVTGRALEIEVENEVRGTITAKGTDSLIVLGQTVFVDGGTVFANVANFAALAVGNAVEVHGQRDASQNIRATRVELLAGPGIVDEVRGVVALKDLPPGTFNIGGATFTYDGGTAIVDPAGGATFANGALVEVHLDAGTNRANRIEIEDDEDNEFKPAEGQEFEVEGFVSGFTATPGTFQVGGQAVQTTSSTRFEGGLGTDLANDVKVEAEGHFQGTTLVADKIKFKDSVRFESNVESKTTDSLTVLGRTVQVTSQTKSGTLLATLNPGDGVRIRAFLNQDNTTFTATELQSTNPVQPDRNIVQGLVISFANPMIVLVKEMPNGFTVDTTGLSDVNFKDDNDFPIGRTAFFAALKAGQTVVRARGTYSSGTLTAGEVEIE